MNDEVQERHMSERIETVQELLDGKEAEILELKKLLLMGLEIHDEYLSQIATCVSQNYGRLNEFPLQCKAKGITLDD